MIGLCAFGFRFNNFYSERSHPFVTQMTDVLIESGKRANRFDIENKLRIFSAAQNLENVKAMHALCDEIIQDRIDHPQPDSNDLLNPMLQGVDSVTGEKMSRDSVRYNMVTFLVSFEALWENSFLTQIGCRTRDHKRHARIPLLPFAQKPSHIPTSTTRSRSSVGRWPTRRKAFVSAGVCQVCHI
jgi:hypothetical protein